MELLTATDAVIRRLLPAVLEAQGRNSAAGSLRNLSEICDHKTMTRALRLIKRVRFHGLNGAPGSIKDVTFWCEKAVWAAAGGDAVAFRKHIDRAHAFLREGMRSQILN